jgi:hypothetical protein
MKTLKHTLQSTVAGLACILTMQSYALAADETKVQTRIGELKFTHAFEHGYPTDETVKKLYDEMDFQRACQAYLWGLPLVSITEWEKEYKEVHGAKDLDFVLYTTYKEKLGILTANVTTPYLFAFANLEETGPIVLELKPGPNASGIADFWQLSVDVGVFGQDKAKGGKYLIVPPGSDMLDVDGYFMVRSKSTNVAIGFRSLHPDNKDGIAWLKSLQLYKYADRKNPPVSKIIEAGNKKWSQVQPRGMAYWERLSDMINREVVYERDRVMMAMLKPLGIEKGKKFNPNKRQKKILMEASLVGEAMAKANSYEKRLEDVYYRKNTHWKYVVLWDPTHETEFYHQLDELAAYTYEAVATNRAMATKIVGAGQAYIGAYKDSKGEWLDGSSNYKLHVPANVPAKRFWSVTLYDVESRCIVENKQEIADKSSRMDLLTNEDGSVDLYFGPKAPKGKEKNWIPTIPNQGLLILCTTILKNTL